MDPNTTERPALLALQGDLILASFIREAGGREGWQVRLADDVPSFRQMLTETHIAAKPPSLLIIDVNHVGLGAQELAGLTRLLPGTPVIAFGRHTQPERLRAAREAGCQVLARSAFVEELPRLLREHHA